MEQVSQTIKRDKIFIDITFTDLDVEIEFIKKQISLIIESYLKMISNFQYKKDAADLITEHILYQLDFIKQTSAIK